MNIMNIYDSINLSYTVHNTNLYIIYMHNMYNL